MQKNKISKESELVFIIVNSANRRRQIAHKASEMLGNSLKSKPFVLIK